MGRCGPGNGGQDVDQVLNCLQLWPADLDICVALRLDLSPPGLDFVVIGNVMVMLVVDFNVVGDVGVQGIPDELAILGPRVVLSNDLYTAPLVAGLAQTPLDNISCEALLVEPPASIHVGGQLHGVRARSEHHLHNFSSRYQDRPGVTIDAVGVHQVRLQQLADGVHLAEVAVGGDDVRLHTGVGAQPVADQLVHAAVDAVERRLGQGPYILVRGSIRIMAVDPCTIRLLLPVPQLNGHRD
mmetsp:Transcript_8996/g.26952  ORF Transcript_8996/g.26952 Transcript_8996/m.26952 type:complete len:241 (+) Transcript_8996:900-1622(+)